MIGRSVLFLWAAAFLLIAHGAHARISDDVIKIGVLTDMAGVPERYIALGMPWPKLTPVQTFCLSGSSWRIVRPSQPSDTTAEGSAVCQMSIERKCDLSGSG